MNVIRRRSVTAVVMSLRLGEFVVTLMAALTFVGCSGSGVPTAPNNSASQPEIIEVTNDEWVGPEELLYVQCKDDEADTILVIRVTIPNVIDDRPFRIPLCRRNTWKLNYPLSYMAFNADGATPDGFGIGYGGYIGIADATETSVEVSLALNWTATDRSRGSFDESLRVTIGEPSIKQLDGNIKIHWTFQDPASVIDDGDNKTTRQNKALQLTPPVQRAVEQFPALSFILRLSRAPLEAGN